MINDDLTKKLAEAAKKVLANDNTNDKSDDGEGLDKVQPKAVKKKFDDRKDKDIDNDGDVDSSDEYLHKRRKAISKATKEETELEEATELFKKGKITLTKFAMGKGKGVGLQINYGTKFIQVPEKDIKQLYTAMVYVTKSVPQFKESVDLEEGTIILKTHGAMAAERLKKKLTNKFFSSRDQFIVKGSDLHIPDESHIVKLAKKQPEIKESTDIEEGFYYDGMSAKDKKRLNDIYKEMDKNEKQSNDAIKKGDAKTVDKLGKEYHKLRMQVVNFFNEDVDLDEATFYKPQTYSDYFETITFVNDAEAKKAQELFTSMKLTVKRNGKRISFNNTAEFKIAKSKVMAESIDLEEGKFDKLQKKLGRINPETLGDVMDGKIKLNPAEKKEFDEFMKGVRKMFASK